MNAVRHVFAPLMGDCLHGADEIGGLNRGAGNGYFFSLGGRFGHLGAASCAAFDFDPARRGLEWACVLDEIRRWEKVDLLVAFATVVKGQEGQTTSVGRSNKDAIAVGVGSDLNGLIRAVFANEVSSNSDQGTVKREGHEFCEEGLEAVCCGVHHDQIG